MQEFAVVVYLPTACPQHHKSRVLWKTRRERINQLIIFFFFNLNRYWKQSQTSEMDSSPDEFLDKGSIDAC